MHKLTCFQRLQLMNQCSNLDFENKVIETKTVLDQHDLLIREQLFKSILEKKDQLYQPSEYITF